MKSPLKTGMSGGVTYLQQILARQNSGPIFAIGVFLEGSSRSREIARTKRNLLDSRCWSMPESKKPAGLFDE
jgi:hypothetical protein